MRIHSGGTSSSASRPAAIVDFDITVQYTLGTVHGSPGKSVPPDAARAVIVTSWVWMWSGWP